MVAVLEPLVPTNLLVPAMLGIGRPRAAMAGIVKIPPPPAMASIMPAPKAMAEHAAICGVEKSGKGWRLEGPGAP